jgi:hypothetical protein
VLKQRVREKIKRSSGTAFEKLIIAGEQAGFTVDQITDLLERGMTIGMLLKLIELRLSALALPPSSSRWVM